MQILVFLPCFPLLSKEIHPISYENKCWKASSDLEVQWFSSVPHLGWFDVYCCFYDHIRKIFPSASSVIPAGVLSLSFLYSNRTFFALSIQITLSLLWEEIRKLDHIASKSNCHGAPKLTSQSSARILNISSPLKEIIPTPGEVPLQSTANSHVLFVYRSNAPTWQRFVENTTGTFWIYYPALCITWSSFAMVGWQPTPLKWRKSQSKDSTLMLQRQEFGMNNQTNHTVCCYSPPDKCFHLVNMLHRYIEDLYHLKI